MANNEGKKSKKTLFIILGVILALIILVMALGGNDDSSTDTAANNGATTAAAADGTTAAPETTVAETTAPPQETVIYEDDNCAFIITGMTKSTLGTYADVNFRMVNKSPTKLGFYLTHITVNGNEVALMGPLRFTDNTDNDSIKIESADLEKYGMNFDSISQVGFNLQIYESDDQLTAGGDLVNQGFTWNVQ